MSGPRRVKRNWRIDWENHSRDTVKLAIEILTRLISQPKVFIPQLFILASQPVHLGVHAPAALAPKPWTAKPEKPCDHHADRKCRKERQNSLDPTLAPHCSYLLLLFTAITYAGFLKPVSPDVQESTKDSRATW